MAVAKFWASQGMGRPLYRYRDPAGTTPPCCRRHSSGSSGGGERDPVDGVGEPAWLWNRELNEHLLCLRDLVLLDRKYHEIHRILFGESASIEI